MANRQTVNINVRMIPHLRPRLPDDSIEEEFGPCVIDKDEESGRRIDRRV